MPNQDNDATKIMGIIEDKRFVPSITCMQDLMQGKYGYRPARSNVHKIYGGLVRRGIIYETGMNPVWAYTIK